VAPESLGVPCPPEITPNAFLDYVLNRPGQVVSYPQLAIDFPELARGHYRKNSASAELRAKTNKEAKTRLGSDWRFCAPSQSAIPFGEGLVYVNGQGEDVALEELRLRCKDQATYDLLNFYASCDLQNQPQFSVKDKQVIIPQLIQFGSIPEPYHALVLSQDSTEPNLLYFSRRSHLQVFTELCDKGYLDDIALERIGINPASINKIMNSIKQAVSDGLDSTLERLPTIGVSLDGDYRYRNQILTGWYQRTFGTNHRLTSLKLDRTGWKRDFYGFKQDKTTGLEIFYVHSDIINRKGGLVMSRSYPHLVVMKLFADDDFRYGCIEASDSVFNLISGIKASLDGRLYIGRHCGQFDLSNNEYTNAKRSLGRAMERLATSGFQAEDLDYFTLGDSLFPTIRIGQYNT